MYALSICKEGSSLDLLGLSFGELETNILSFKINGLALIYGRKKTLYTQLLLAPSPSEENGIYNSHQGDKNRQNNLVQSQGDDNSNLLFRARFSL